MEEVLLSKWVMKRYLLLRHELGNKKSKEFTFKDVETALKKIDDDSRIATLFLAELRKAICHNIVVLVQSMNELGIEPNFLKS